jgi:hypothetical protein
MDKENKEYGFINIYVDTDKTLYDGFTELNRLFDDFENIGRVLAEIADGWRGRIDTLPKCAREDALLFIARYDNFLKEVADERTRLGNLVVLDRIKKSWDMRYRKDNGEKTEIAID